MISLSYVSAAQHHFDEPTLVQMLQKFRSSNEVNDVTGLLLYNGRGTFLQWIEGDDEQIENLFQKIKGDERHTRVHCLSRRHCDERLFPEWRMGFRYMDDDSLKSLKGYSDFLDAEAQDTWLLAHEEFSTALFQHFKYLTHDQNTVEH